VVNGWREKENKLYPIGERGIGERKEPGGKGLATASILPGAIMCLTAAQKKKRGFPAHTGGSRKKKSWCREYFHQRVLSETLKSKTEDVTAYQSKGGKKSRPGKDPHQGGEIMSN